MTVASDLLDDLFESLSPLGEESIAERRYRLLRNAWVAVGALVALFRLRTVFLWWLHPERNRYEPALELIEAAVWFPWGLISLWLQHRLTRARTSKLGPQADIDRLHWYSARTLSQLKRSSAITYGGKPHSVERDCVVQLLRNRPIPNTALTGSAGVGKSGALYSIAIALKRTAAEVIVLSVDDFNDGTVEDALRINRRLDQLLLDWPSSTDGEAYLLIDGLDEARSPRASDQLLRRLSAIVASGRWNLLVTIRRYDLIQSLRTRSLFPDPAPSSGDPQLIGVRHVAVTDLSMTELDSLLCRSAPLKKAAGRFGDWTLLSNPFNLALFTEVLRAAPESDLSHVSTQAGLLDRFWDARILSGNTASTLEPCLRKACEAMVATQRRRFDLQALPETCSHAMSNLLSSSVIVADRQSMARFAHPVIFDYGIARLLFDRDGTTVLRQIIGKDNFVGLLFTPSIDLFWMRRWRDPLDRTSFWSAVFEVEADPSLPSSVKLTWPRRVLADAASLEDVQALAPKSGVLKDGQRTALRRLAMILESSEEPLTDRQRSVLLALLEQVIATPTLPEEFVRVALVRLSA